MLRKFDETIPKRNSNLSSHLIRADIFIETIRWVPLTHYPIGWLATSPQNKAVQPKRITTNFPILMASLKSLFISPFMTEWDESGWNPPFAGPHHQTAHRKHLSGNTHYFQCSSCTWSSQGRTWVFLASMPPHADQRGRQCNMVSCRELPTWGHSSLEW